MATWVYPLSFVVALVAVVLDVKRRQQRRRTRGLPYPPGPTPEPIIGNARQMPTEFAWLRFTEWGRQYGPLTYLNLSGQPTLIINSLEAAKELLDKRSNIYSDRPSMIMCGELIDCNWLTTLQRYGPQFKEHRRLWNSALNQRIIQPNYGGILEKWMAKLLEGLLDLDRPDRYEKVLKYHIGAVIVEITYGRMKDGDVDFAEMGEQNAFIFSDTFVGWMVDFIPALKYIPEWFPGGDFKRKARLWRKMVAAGRDLPFDMVKRLRSAGEVNPCFASLLLEELETNGGTPKDEKLIREISGSLYSSGSDTSQATVRAFILAMLLFPKVQKQAQREIDLIIGGERLPTLDDRDSLPYLANVMLETFRWHVIGPTGMAHKLMQDDFYNGYFIPAGTVVYANIWGTTNDPAIYHNPQEFNPDRYEPDLLKSGGVLDPRAFAFGFGRRVCPGIHLAQATVWLAMARILSVFDITPVVDPNTGEEIVPEHKYESGLNSSPVSFPCRFQPRSQAAVSLIRQATTKSQ